MAQEPGSAATRDSPANVRAREVEERMTDDEQFLLLGTPLDRAHEAYEPLIEW